MIEHSLLKSPPSLPPHSLFTPSPSPICPTPLITYLPPPPSRSAPCPPFPIPLKTPSPSLPPLRTWSFTCTMTSRFSVGSRHPPATTRDQWSTRCSINSKWTDVLWASLLGPAGEGGQLAPWRLQGCEETCGWQASLLDRDLMTSHPPEAHSSPSGCQRTLAAR